MKRVVIIASSVIVVLAIAGAAFFMLGGIDKVKAMMQPKSVTKSVTVKGNIVCLPAKDENKTSTLSCAVGIKTTDGKYYGLSGSQNTELSSAEGTDQTATIKGTLEPSSDATYKMDGILAVTSSSLSN
jgi:hypothetical protein